MENHLNNIKYYELKKKRAVGRSADCWHMAILFKAKQSKQTDP